MAEETYKVANQCAIAAMTLATDLLNTDDFLAFKSNTFYMRIKSLTTGQLINSTKLRLEKLCSTE
jgi:hypothetical protein